ncbi:CD40 ligand [Esox lucius]|uniref:THD domain-containing protein n=1 Tax=Esox lucius TaxID=8010 RepID=A0A3P8ZGN4_ESOLU|nr:CD40 ligand [Esox lucius]
MINTYHSSLPPPPIPPRLGSIKPDAGQSKPLLRFLIGMIVLQMVLLLGGFIYLYHMEKVYHMELKYDMITMAKLKECLEDKQSEIKCGEFMEIFKNIKTPVSQKEGIAAKHTGSGSSYGAMARMTVKQTLPYDSSNILKWNMDHSVLKHINYYKSSWLKVLQSGDYSIYTQVTFSMWHPKKPLASQLKLRKRESEEAKTLMTAYCSLNNNTSDVCTAYQGGVFSLDEGDQLSVWVTDLSLVSYDVDCTTFGLYKL